MIEVLMLPQIFFALSVLINIILALFIVRLVARISSLENDLKEIAKIAKKYAPVEKKEAPKPQKPRSFWRLKDQ
jgi:hypothetical protein